MYGRWSSHTCTRSLDRLTIAGFRSDVSVRAWVRACTSVCVHECVCACVRVCMPQLEEELSSMHFLWRLLCCTGLSGRGLGVAWVWSCGCGRVLWWWCGGVEEGKWQRVFVGLDRCADMHQDLQCTLPWRRVPLEVCLGSGVLPRRETVLSVAETCRPCDLPAV